MHFLFGIRTNADTAVCNILTVDLQCVFYLHINAVFFFADIQMCCGDPDQGIISADTLAESYTKIGVIYDSSDTYSSGIYA